MSREKEFEEYWARYYCNDNPNLSNDHPKGDCKHLWDYLYPYKKRCEELESLLIEACSIMERLNKNCAVCNRIIQSLKEQIEDYEEALEKCFYEYLRSDTTYNDTYFNIVEIVKTALKAKDDGVVHRKVYEKWRKGGPDAVSSKS